jgi:rhodanese-related sulfurtransferase
MTNLILDTVRQRAQEENLPYAGATTPEESWTLLQADSNIILIDVRTNAERDWVGRVNIPDAQHGSVQWMLYPSSTPNPDFMAQLIELVPNKSSVLLFLCRSGVRSRHGAKLATENGYSNCVDILQGFEGDKDTQGHRKMVSGWCYAGLPWIGA